MKKRTLLVVTGILFLALTFNGCKKDSTSKDYTPLFKNKVWTGEFHYTGSAVQPVSIEFKEGGSLTWHELLSDVSGTWKIENGVLTVSFAGNKGFTSEILGDNQLTNFQNLAANNFSMDNAMLNETAEVSLDNTVWTGPNIVVTFKPGNLVDLKLGGSTLYSNLSYSRAGKSIHFNPLTAYRWFVVISSSSEMKGSNMFSPDPTVYIYSLNK